jgi:hypothetical protein
VTPVYLAAYGNCVNALFSMLHLMGGRVEINTQIEPHGGTALHGMNIFISLFFSYSFLILFFLLLSLR